MECPFCDLVLADGAAGCPGCGVSRGECEEFAAVDQDLRVPLWRMAASPPGWVKVGDPGVWHGVPEDLGVLGRLLELPLLERPQQAAEALLQVARNNFEKTSFSLPSYRTAVLRCLGKLRIRHAKDAPVAVLEIDLLNALLKRLSQEEREQLEQAVLAQAQAEGSRPEWASTARSGTLVGAIVAGELGGFATYTLMSMLAKFVAGLVGVTLPFAFYTAMSRVLSIVLGPIGWTLSGAHAVWTLGRAGVDYRRLLPAVLWVAAVRRRPRPGVVPFEEDL